MHKFVGRIVFAIFFALMLSPLAVAQFAESQPPHTQASAAAIGGAVGSPTFVVPPPKGSSIGNVFGDFLQPYVDASVTAVITALVGWLAYTLKQKTGIDIDAGHRAAIEHALTKQANSLIADGAVKFAGAIDIHPESLKAASEEVMKFVPGAAKHFGITPEYVAARIVDTIPQVPAGAQIIAANHPQPNKSA
jgi:H+/gluconate symporter-like permease